MSKPQLKDTSMDMIMTGHLIKRLVREGGYSVSEVQNRLGLSCPQPVYRWYRQPVYSKRYAWAAYGRFAASKGRSFVACRGAGK